MRPTFPRAWIAASTRYVEPLLWFLVVLLPVLAVWHFDFFPSQDGYAHLYTARLLDDYVFLRDLPFTLIPDFQPAPNWFSQIFLLLGGHFFGLAAAQRLLLTLYLVLFPFLLRWNSVRQEGAWPMAWLILPLTLNHFLFFGFYNYLFGVLFLLLLTGFLLRLREPVPISCWWIISLLGIVIYFSHSLPAGFAIVAILLRFRKSLRANAKGLLFSLLPLVSLLAWFKWNAASSVPVWQSVPLTLHQLLFLDALSPFSTKVSLPVLLWLVLFCTAILVELKRFRQWVLPDTSYFFTLAGFTALLCFIMPDQTSGGAIIQYRLTLLPWIFACLAFVPRLRVLGLLLAALSMGVYGIQLGALAKVLSASQDQYREFESVMSSFPEKSIVLNWNEDRFGRRDKGESLGGRTALFEHAHGLAALRRDHLILLNYYQGHWSGFPFKERTPVPCEPGQWNAEALLSWEKETGRKIDYLVIQGSGSDLLPQGMAAMFETFSVPDVAGRLKVWKRVF